MDPAQSYSPIPILEAWAKRLTQITKFDEAETTISLICEVRKTLEAYVTHILANNLETQIREDLLITIQNQLVRATQDIEKNRYSPADSERIFLELSSCHESFKTLLVDHTSRKGWIASALGLYQETSSPQEIKWKIKKYEKLVLELSKATMPLLSEPSKILAKGIQLPEHYQLMVDTNNVDRFTLDYLNLLRRKYCTDFIENLRTLLQEFPADDDLLEICYHLFCNISLDEDNQYVLQLFDKWGDKCLKYPIESKFSHREVKEIYEMVQKVKAVPNTAKAPLLSQWANSARGVLNRGFDPDVQGNPIHCIYSVKIGGKMIKSLGFGTPTIEPKTIFNSAKLTPEFLGFLTTCKNRGRKHLFITNQDITSNGYIGAEKQRCDLVLDLQNVAQFKGTFFAIALSKNSLFYYQESKEYTSAKDFIDDLLAQFNDPNSGCVISREIMEMTQLNLRTVAEVIHSEFFNQADILEQNERQLFIEFFYDQITKWLIQKLEVDTYNISCKDAIDRGAASNAQLYSHLAIINQIFEGEHLQRTKVLMIVRALLVRKRPPDIERVVRFLESLDFYLSHPNELIAIHQKLFGDSFFLPCGN